MQPGNLSSSINFVHSEECKQENGLEVETFPRTRQKDLGAWPLLTEAWSVYGVPSTELYRDLS